MMSSGLLAVMLVDTSEGLKLKISIFGYSDARQDVKKFPYALVPQ